MEESKDLHCAFCVAQMAQTPSLENAEEVKGVEYLCSIDQHSLAPQMRRVEHTFFISYPYYKSKEKHATLQDLNN